MSESTWSEAVSAVVPLRPVVGELRFGGVASEEEGEETP
jgi:hypothetical protein